LRRNSDTITVVALQRLQRNAAVTTLQGVVGEEDFFAPWCLFGRPSVNRLLGDELAPALDPDHQFLARKHHLVLFPSG
jgi:hypothetical protein